MALVTIFGSSATGRRREESDIDIGIVFDDTSRQQREPVAVYDELREEMRKHFSGKIDLVYLEDSSLSLRYRAITDGKILYENRDGGGADYKEKVLKHYFDFQFIENIFRQGLMTR